MSSPLIIVPPLTITPAMLVDTDVPEDPNPAWSAVATYGEDQRAHADHVVYQSIQGGNLNRPPATSPDWWKRVGPTNRWALFDGSNSTQTAKSTSMSYTLQPVGAVTVLAVLNAKGCSAARVRFIQPTHGVLYDRTFRLAGVPTARGIWAWFFGERRQPDVMVAADLPSIPGCTIVVDFVGTTALAIGVLLVGQARRVGIGVKSGARVGIDDRSRKETDEWAQTVLVERNFNKRSSFEVPVAADQIESVISLLNARRARPTLYIGARSRASMVIFGFYQSYEVVHEYEDLSELSINLQDLG